MSEHSVANMKNFVVRIPAELEKKIRMQSHRESLERNVHLRPTDLVREILSREIARNEIS